MISPGQMRAGEALIRLLDAKTKPTLPRKLPVFYKGYRQGKSCQTRAGYKTVKRRVLPSLLVNSSKYQPENQCVQILITSGSKSPLPRNTSIGLHRRCIFPLIHAALGAALRTSDVGAASPHTGYGLLTPKLD